LDAGISGKQAQARLAEHGLDIRGVSAVLISHDHADHVRCMGIYQREFGLPVWVTAPTLRAAQGSHGIGELSDMRAFVAGQTLQFGGLAVETIPTPHDGADGVAFVVADGRRRVGVLTDLGHVFDGLAAVIASLDAVLLESNYDPDMLEHGPYPAHLKARIRGPHGHLSNDEAAALLASCAAGRLRWACLAHLSEQNNQPALALRTHRRILGESGTGNLPLLVASRYRVGDVLEV
jgi:phosphoribosyl 1,2-cyclic phosphodiesterase